MATENKTNRAGSRNFIPSRSVQQAIMKNLVDKALGGDIKASEVVLTLADKMGYSVLTRQEKA